MLDDRHDDRIREQELRQAEASVDFFLQANRDFSRCNENRGLMLRWLDDNNLPLNHTTLLQAFDELNHQLVLSSDNNAEYGATRVVDYKDLQPVKLPAAPQARRASQNRHLMACAVEPGSVQRADHSRAINKYFIGPQVQTLLSNEEHPFVGTSIWQPPG